MRYIYFISLFALSACDMREKMDRVGRTPPLHDLATPTRETLKEEIVIPTHSIINPRRASNTLWRTGGKGFFKDQRALRQGDIIRINVNLSNNGTFLRQKNIETVSSQSVGIGAMMGFENQVKKFLPKRGDLKNLLNTTNNSKTNPDDDNTIRTETITTTVPALIVEILPNGMLRLEGRQEIRLNNEVRELAIAGFARREDIDSQNTVELDRMTEVRMNYGGKGDITDAMTHPIGTQAIKAITPF